MLNQFTLTNELLNSPKGIFQIFSVTIISFCVFAIIISVIINFIEGYSKKNVKTKKNSVVETGTMFGFFFVYYLTIKFKIGTIPLENPPLNIIIILVGLATIIIGTIVNIKGRFNLGKNWSNQIKIYTDQTLVTKGIYSKVRHPLYASLIWMFYAGSFVYLNWAAFLLNTLVFVPFMYYRAKQEEKLLSREFKNYKNYKLKVGMFFPKIR